MTIAQLETNLRAKQTAARTLLEATMRACETDATATTPAVSRAMTAEERGAVDALLAEAQTIRAQIDTARGQANLAASIEQLTAGMTAARSSEDPAHPVSRRSLGTQFVEHAEYQQFIRGQLHRRSGAWSSPTIELRGTTLDSSPGSGGPLLSPQVLPGINELAYRPLVVRDLLAPGTTDSNAILYLQEKTFTNAAAAVAEGAQKPESTLVFSNATSPVKKLAHWLPVTEEMLEDYPAIRSFIDARLRLGLQLTEDDELLNGSGIDPHLLGLRMAPGLSPDVVRGADTNADAILKQIAAIATTALVQPDAVVLNPLNWLTIQLTKNTQGNYIGTGPFAGPQTGTIWGIPVANTPAIPAGVALVGAYKMSAQIFDKGGIRIEISNSHADFFIKNLIAIRAEERLALAIYRPAGFGEVTGLN